MKKKLLIIVLILGINTISGAQELEDLGSGIIDFFLSNPHTAKKTNQTQTAALGVISNLLSNRANRKHDMNIAVSGKDEIIINSGNGNQSTIYLDAQGNVYLLYNGMIVPISAGLINQAKTENMKPSRYTATPSIKNATLLDYDISALENEYIFNKEIEYKEEKIHHIYELESEQEYVNAIVSKFNLTKNDIYFQPYFIKKGETYFDENIYNFNSLKGRCYAKRQVKELIKVENSEIPIEKTYEGCHFSPGIFFPFSGFNATFGGNKIGTGYIIHLKKETKTSKSVYKFEIVTSFTCNWVKDFDHDGLDINDFQGIKRSFYEGENIMFVFGYTSESSISWKLEIYNSTSGETVYDETGVSPAGGQVISTKKEYLPNGCYIYNFTASTSEDKRISRSEKFEIIDKD